MEVVPGDESSSASFDVKSLKSLNYLQLLNAYILEMLIDHNYLLFPINFH